MSYVSNYGTKYGSGINLSTNNYGTSTDGGFTFGYDPFGELKNTFPTLVSSPSVFTTSLNSAPKGPGALNASGFDAELMKLFSSALKKTKDKKETSEKTDKTSTNSDEQPAKKEKELDGVENDGIIYYTESGLNKTVADKAGKTTTKIGGSQNSLHFNGDDGENTFIVGGKINNTRIDDIGSDDKVILEGKSEDWEVTRYEEKNNGAMFSRKYWFEIEYKNTKTGSTVTATTKQKSNKEKIDVKSHVNFIEKF